MPVKYSDFLLEARRFLSGDSVQEIHLRFAISRAYYGLYHRALEYADSVSVPPVSACGGKTHEKLRLYFSNDMHADKITRIKHRKIGYSLKQVHDLRVIADYQLAVAVDYVQAESVLSRCEELANDVSGLMVGSAA